MLRSFLPIGQGAFYREVFCVKGSQHTIIYDCGSSTDKTIVEQQIKNDFSKNEAIEAVFISHLDEDHINGLPFLLNYCQVKNLFFPLVTTKDQVYLKLNAILSTGKKGFLYNFIQDPGVAFSSIGVKSVPRLYQISALEDEGWNGNNAQRIVSGNNVANILGLSPSKEFSWELIPFNFRQKDRIDTLKAALAEVFDGRLDELEKVGEGFLSYPDKKDKIRKAYQRVKGSFNTNSMTLFSGIREHGIRQYYAVSKHDCYSHCCYRGENGCLYLGDYDASGKYKWNALKKAYSGYWEYVGCIQLPHHGSGHNYNEEFSKLDAINIISAGYKNSYRHPHSSVIKDLVLNDKRVHIVTENVGSQVDLKVNYF